MDDLISRKALLEKAWEADTQCGYVQVVDVGDIEDAPVVDAAPVVHGRWVAMHYEGGILDSYGRGMTLRTENAQRLEIIKEIPIDRLRKLAQAEKEGRLVVLQNVKYTDSDGEKALRHAMYMCGVQNNPVTRYTADAIAEKLTREAAEAALKEREAEHDR